jgi:hypothetical protein
MEVVSKFTKFATFSNFSHMFLRTKNCPQIFERDIDFREFTNGQIEGICTRIKII